MLVMRRWRKLGLFSLRDSVRLAIRFPKYAAHLLRDCAGATGPSPFPRRIGFS
jgi:hypothetical protein